MNRHGSCKNRVHEGCAATYCTTSCTDKAGNERLEQVLVAPCLRRLSALTIHQEKGQEPADVLLLGHPCSRQGREADTKMLNMRLKKLVDSHRYLKRVLPNQTWCCDTCLHDAACRTRCSAALAAPSVALGPPQRSIGQIRRRLQEKPRNTVLEPPQARAVSPSSDTTSEVLMYIETK